MYKYSNGINLIAGGEKHKIYVKKSPTGVGKGVKGHVMVNHPTEDKGKWDTIDLTKKAGAKTVEDGKNATKKWHAENPYLSGAKSVKQYRGDENLPEAKKGMKNCGCKHSKSKYKYQDGSKDVSSTEDYMDYLELIKNRLSKGSNYYDFILNSYKKDFRNPNKNRYIVDKKLESKEEPVERKEEKPIKKPSQILPRRRTGVHSTINANKSFKLFKEGTGALTIPEGSAIVTANGGKNKQALMAYKKGNYKLLNNIIEDMPEDNVDKAQAGKQSTKGKKITGKIQNRQTAPNETFTEQSALGYDPSYGQEMTEDKAKELYGLSLSDLIKKRNAGQLPKVSFDLEIERRNAVANNQEKFDYNGKPYLSGLKKQTTGGGGGTTPVPPPGTTPTTPPGDEYEEVMTDDIKPSRPVMSTAETSAIGGVLGQGVPAPPRESYLKLDRYNYASQLPKTLQENSLAAQTGMEKSRDIVGGDAGRYLAQAGNISSARMKANNEAVIQDTLARQDILNKNVDLSNTEATTNRTLKDYYDDIKRQNINDYNALLVKGGQSFDESFDTYQKMKNENELKAQELQLLKEANPNYTMVKDPNTGLMRSAYRYKKVNSGQTPQTPRDASYQFKPGFVGPVNPADYESDPNFVGPRNKQKNGLKKAKTYKRK